MVAQHLRPISNEWLEFFIRTPIAKDIIFSSPKSYLGKKTEDVQ